MKKRVIFKQIDAFQQRRVEGDGCLCQITILLCDAAQDRVSRPPETVFKLPIPSLLAFTMIQPMTKQITLKHLEDGLGL